MTHDPLCLCATHKSPHIQHLNGVCHYCQCGLIARVRADERKQCIAAVEAVPHDFHCTSLDDRKPPCNCPQGEALAELRALQEKP